MESWGIASHLIHCRQGPRPGPGPKDPRRRRPNPDLNPAVRRWDRGTRAAGAPDPDLDPDRAIRRIPTPPAPSGASHAII